MRVFVFEYMTGGGFADDRLMSSLTIEGDMMLTAVVRDLIALDGVDVVICRDRQFEPPDLPIEVVWVDGDWRSYWEQCVAGSDAVLPIAPESGRLLETLCRDVEEAGKLLLSSSSQAVALAASKQSTIERLAAEDVPVVSSWRADRIPPLKLLQPLVMKLDMGAGCEGMHLLPGTQALGEFLAQQVSPSSWLAQPYIAGRAASLSLLVGRDCVCLLGCNLQRVAQVDDGFMLLGCVVNGLTGSDAELVTLGQRLCRAIPGLWGYVGVDFILTDAGPVVLEVNPRITTSYVGLSRSIGCNAAALILRLAADPGQPPASQLSGKPVHVDLELGRVA